ncbi:complex I subunit 5 family protein [Corallococcus exiguus]|uniref:complex I subunit 5 family protein n=1 Tax=Corallococcus exiguus TaxID=83462 RepID=UPI001493F51E|nr:proton-conducting transporter membrane subunit [Corallococcus exiguus]NPD26913.1 NADH-ubiquinone/plastoquinone oxidoreductase [Corallococcus exiguus]
MPLWGPLLLPWVLGVVLAFLDGRRAWVAWLAIAGLAGTLVCTVWLLPQAWSAQAPQFVTGDWPVGVGIRLRADQLSIVFALVSTAVLLGTLVYEHVAGGITSRSFPALVVFMGAGLTGVFFTSDAFNFYVFFELAMTSAFALASYGEKPRNLRAAFTFVVVNLMGSSLFLTAVVMLYLTTGTLDMLSIIAWGQAGEPFALLVPGTLLLCAFGVKLGFFPFHFWAPAVYRDAGPTVAALLAGALANIGSYGLLRFGVDVMPQVLAQARPLLEVLGATSILYGSVLALSRRDTREVLAYASITQAGLIIAALSLDGREGLCAAVALALAGSVDKTALFLAQDRGGERARRAYSVAAFSTAGVPPTAGFWSKAWLLRAALEQGHAWLAGLVVLASALSLLALFRAYQRERWLKEGAALHRGTGAVVYALSLALIATGLWPEPLLRAGRDAIQGLGSLP